MANVDVTELLVDLDLVDPMIVINRQSYVDEYGQNQLRETSYNTFGSIQSISGKALERLPDMYRLENVMTFFVKGKIISDGKCEYPDLLSFRGSRYAVRVINDWTNWGEGFSEGLCVRERPSI